MIFVSIDSSYVLSFTISKYLRGRIGSDKEDDILFEVKYEYEQVGVKFLDNFNEYLYKVSSKSACICLWDFFVRLSI